MDEMVRTIRHAGLVHGNPNPEIFTVPGDTIPAIHNADPTRIRFRTIIRDVNKDGVMDKFTIFYDTTTAYTGA